LNLRRLKDPWKLFALGALAVALGLVVLPQLWIFLTSFQKEGGKFHLKADSSQARLTVIEETVTGYELARLQQGALRVQSRGEPLFTILSEGPRSLLLEACGGEALGGWPGPEGTVRLKVKGSQFIVSQKVFFSFLDSQSSAEPLEIQALSPGSARLRHAENAFLLFEDRSRHLTLANYLTFLSQNQYLRALVNSLFITLCATALAAAVSISLAYALARYRIPGTPTILVLVTMASVAPPFLGAYAWRMLLGSQGILTTLLRLHWTIVGIHGVIWVIAWLVFPLIFLLCYDAFTAVDQSLRESSMSLGADRRKTLFKIEIPLALPGLITGLYLAMMAAFADFGTPFIISLDLQVLPVLIYKEYMSEVGSNLSIASTGSVLMILVSSLILTGQRVYLSARSYAALKRTSPAALQPTRAQRLLVLAFTAVVLFFAFLPHLTVLVTSFLRWSSGVATTTWTLSNYLSLFRHELRAVFVSLFLGLSATALDFLFGIGIAYILVRQRYPVLSDLLNVLVMMPYVVPGTVLGLGFILVFNQPPLLLTGTGLIMVLAYFIRKLPYSVKSSEAALYQIHPALEEAAKSLGARPLRSFSSVTFPLIIGGILSGASLSFLHIMTELSSTIMLYRPPWKPMTAVIFENTISAGADFGIAGAMTVLLMLLLYLPLYLITVKTRNLGERRIEPI